MCETAYTTHEKGLSEFDGIMFCCVRKSELLDNDWYKFSMSNFNKIYERLIGLMKKAES
jgi:hypothetical protein